MEEFYDSKEIATHLITLQVDSITSYKQQQKRLPKIAQIRKNSIGDLPIIKEPYNKAIWSNYSSYKPFDLEWKMGEIPSTSITSSSAPIVYSINSERSKLREGLHCNLIWCKERPLQAKEDQSGICEWLENNSQLPYIVMNSSFNLRD